MDDWIKRKIGLADAEKLTREALESYQLKKLVETLQWVQRNSSFYKKLFNGIDPDSFTSLKDIERIPFVTEQDLREKAKEMLCVRDAEISRIVTLETSGTTASPKRVYYTEEDQELTVDFFHHGMRNLTDESDTVLILMPCARPGSVGDLLDAGLRRMGAKTIPYGFLKPDYEDIPELLQRMDREAVTSIVGTPTQVRKLAAACTPEAGISFPENYLASDFAAFGKVCGRIAQNMRSVLLSAEYVPEETCRQISNVWKCQVFEHYGMTEMGLGGAVSCFILKGYHPREADLYFEIINPQTGEVVPDGVTGEVVFTTLTRKGMPFIRYRTGDTSRWLIEPCGCGSVLKRLDKVGDRKQRKGAYSRSAEQLSQFL